MCQWAVSAWSCVWLCVLVCLFFCFRAGLSEKFYASPVAASEQEPQNLARGLVLFFR